MKITKQELHQIISEEISAAVLSLAESKLDKVNWDRISSRYKAVLLHKGDVDAKDVDNIVQQKISVAKMQPNGLEDLRKDVLKIYNFDITDNKETA
tara:strand:- start:1362 stop:1649 length:288 start_codon:yes stop_codon:yes gene_type:complete